MHSDSMEHWKCLYCSSIKWCDILVMRRLCSHGWLENIVSYACFQTLKWQKYVQAIVDFCTLLNKLSDSLSKELKPLGRPKCWKDIIYTDKQIKYFIMALHVQMTRQPILFPLFKNKDFNIWLNHSRVLVTYPTKTYLCSLFDSYISTIKVE